ncbi:Phosphatidylinositol 3- and 4-kinase family protein [Trichomonas vaginalis G3]|uniref:Phosphatidylinositol 3-and 4-kinase family protein n=1 Tax=Trichomonas vaginalis (strain ATCC PRA-98 / G3) TaxID=412133 RepID=A2DPP4_TRIV3|nr:ataxia telangiectasia mutated (ATM) -related family [Trichomonas vaginalis G3]EAY17644.1 Phosphatidylinositol 3- and 4-kinase family protein [Trichomonas vaginalis G3]KAI5486112.1 ataxia telangiectasia mutated (ATM) -related family [Trichomonas vaginalis G3]|eukprot:XP_001329779.1 Phosphatidylinositol 3- and 4-kinase family protein [Trichomonas vaginalis G3]
MLPTKGALPYEPLSDNTDEFSRWKQSRRRIIKEIDKTILNQTDEELKEFVDNWLEIANDHKEFVDPLSILKGLMHLSVYYHYHHDFTSIQILVPIVNNFVSHPKRCIARVATRVLWWLAEDSTENIDFFHSIVSEVPKWLEKPLTDQLFYSSLCILHNAYGYADQLVNGFVTQAFPQIMHATFCDDKELQHITLSVLKHHLMSQKPKDLDRWFNFCIEQLNSQDPNKFKGALRVTGFFFEFNYFTNTEPILKVLMNQVNKSMADSIVEFLYNLSRLNLIDYNKCHFYYLFLSLLFTSNPLLISIMEKLPNNHPPELENVKILNGKIDTPFLYGLVSVICKKFPFYHNRFIIVHDPTFSKEYLNLLRNNMEYRFTVHPKLSQFCLSQLSQPTSEANTITALRIAKYFGHVIFNKTETQLIDQILNLLHSDNETIRVAAAKAIKQNGVGISNPYLLRIALFDTSARVRLAAIKRLSITDEILESRSTAQLLNDADVDVKLAALKFVEEAASQNPILFYPELFRFVSQCLETFSGMKNFIEIANYSKLFPIIAKLVVDKYQPFIPQLAQFCLLFLSRGSVFSHNLDYFVEDENLIPPCERKPSLRGEIFGSLYSSHIDERDCNLIKTLKILSPFMESYADVIFEIIGGMIINTKTKDIVLISCVNCLRRNIIHIPIEDTFSNRFPPLTNRLFKILSTTLNEKLAIKIMKLFGNAGVCSLPNYQEVSDATFAFVDVDKKDFVINALLDAITKNIDSHPPSVFDVVKSAYRYEPNAAIKYTQKIIPSIILALKKSTIEQIEHLFSILSEITLIIGHRMDEYAEQICILIRKYLTSKNATECCISLSYVLNSSLSPYMPPIFFDAINLVINHQSGNYKSHFKLLAFSVLYQNQPLHLFIKACESCIHINPKIVVREMCRILQNSVVASYFGSSMWRIVNYLIPWTRELCLQLLYSLILFKGITDEQAKIVIKNASIVDENLDILLKMTPEQRMLNGIPDFVKQKKAKVEPQFMHVKNLTTNQVASSFKNNNPTNTVFSEVKSPLTTSLTSWQIDLSNKTVTRSPNNVIRDSQKLIIDSEYLRGKILPIAFLSCFLNTSSDQKEVFLKQLNDCFSLGQKINSSIYKIIDLLEMLGYNHIIEDKKLAENSSSPWRSIFYWRRLFINNSEMDLEPMLDKMYKMGRMMTIRGILDMSNNNLPPMRLAYWRERVLDFEGSLKIYENENSLPNVIRTISFMERWDEVRELYNKFEKMDDNDKSLTSSAFCSSFYYDNQLDIADNLLKYFPKSESLRIGFVRIIVLIKEGKYEEAKICIMNKFKHLVQNREIYSGTNVHMALRYLIYGQHLSELSDVIKIKQNTDNNMKHLNMIWTRHLNNFRGKGRDWRELSDIRNLLKTDKSNEEETKEEEEKSSEKTEEEKSSDYSDDQIIISPFAKARQNLSRTSFTTKQIDEPEIANSPIVCTFQTTSKVGLSNLTQNLSFCQNLTKEKTSPLAKSPKQPMKNYSPDKMSKLSSFYMTNAKNKMSEFKPSENLTTYEGIPKLPAKEEKPKDLLISDVNLKMAVALRKDRQWNILSGIHKRIAKESLSHDIFLERIKSQWAKGKREIALNKIEYLLKCYLSSPKDLPAIIKQMPDSAQNDFKSIWKSDILQKWQKFLTSNKPSPMIIAQTIRTVTSWRIRQGLLTNKEEIEKNCKLLNSAIENDKTNKRAYFNYGFSLMQLLLIQENHDNKDVKSDNKSDNKSDIAFQCITSLLHCPSLPSMSLFTWLVTFLDDKTAQRIDLTKFKSEFLVKLLPRFVDLLSKDKSSCRSIAKIVITRLSYDFQKVVFPLRSKIHVKEVSEILLNLCNSSEKNYKINVDAGSLINLLKMKSSSKKEKAEKIVEKLLKDQNSEIAIKRNISELENLIKDDIPDDVTFDVRTILNLMNSDSQEKFIDIDKILEKMRNYLSKNNKGQFLSQKETDVKWRSFCVSVPGVPTTLIESVSPVINVLQTPKRQRVVEMVGDGMKFRFLLFANDLYDDERFSIFVDVIRSMFVKDESFVDFAPFCPKIFPLCEDCGLIKINGMTETIEEIMTSFSAKRKHEREIADEHLGLTRFSTLNKIQNIEIFKKLSENSLGDELLESIWRAMPAVSKWVRTGDKITMSYASNSMLCYVMRIEDRNPGNILIEKDSGNVCLIDYSSIFSKTKEEKVKFRMTKCVRNLMDGANPFGMFQFSCEKIMEFLCEKRVLIMSQLKVSFPENEMIPYDDIDRRMLGIDRDVDDETRNVRDMVSKLIEISSENTNIYSMNFEWKPYW